MTDSVESTKSPSDCYDGLGDEVYIHTQRGRFYLAYPTWDIDAMAHSLGQKARYGGNAGLQVSVAEHSMLVSLLMEEETGGDPLEGLLHDGTESVLPDMPSPFKHLLPDFRSIENRLETSLREAFGLAARKTVECSRADWLALFIESDQILPEFGKDFPDPHGLRARALALRDKGWMCRGFQWDHARDLFIARYSACKRT